MSKLSDYCKFDHLDDSDGEEGPLSQAADEACQQLEDVIAPAIALALHGETWESALKGQAVVDAFTKQEIQKDLMLERFQEENLGFDFRDADFSGSVPDPRTFMGGVKYS
jgi:hypothetical protein